MTGKNSLHTISGWLIALTLGLLPVFFLPLTRDYYATNKWMLLAVAAAFMLIITGLRIITRKTPVQFAIPDGAVGFGAVSIAAVVSLLVSSVSKIEALTDPFGPVTFVSLTILLWAAAGMNELTKTLLRRVLYISAIVLSLTAVYQFFGIGKIMFPGVLFLGDPMWTPAGATTAALGFVAVVFGLLFSDSRMPKEYRILTGLIIAAGFGITIWQLIPKIPTALLPIGTAIRVTIEILKTGKTALAGIGAENFVSLYTRGRPLSLLSTPLWNTRFTANADVLLHIAAIYGLIGLTALLVMATALIRRAKGRSAIAIIICIAAFLLLPPGIPILAAAAALFILFGRNHHIGKPQFLTAPVRLPIGIFLVLAGISALYFLGRAYVAELYYGRALAAAQKNEGTNTYNLHIKTIESNPFIPTYHITMAQTSLMLANSIAQAKKSEDQNLVNRLIQQAIAEAKVAVTMNTQSGAAWENLGSLYQTLMPIAKGSDAWAEAAYQAALRLDPNNPALMVNFGSVLIHEKKYDDAKLVLNRAIVIKPDYANAYYNLASVYKLTGDPINEQKALTQALSLVPSGSSDYAKIKNELDGLSQDR
jgi:tetratricopeptide (TPR) repeat protein